MSVGRRVLVALLGGSLIASAFSVGAGAQSPLPPAEWGPEHNTPGVTLTYREVKRERAANLTRVMYAPIASGFPNEKTYIGWSWRLGRPPKAEVKLSTSNGGADWEKGLELTLHHMAKAEPFRFAIISTDQTVIAFLEIIPFPVGTRDGSCRLWVELGAKDGKSFKMHGSGFVPDEDVTTVARSGLEVVRSQNKISSTGALPIITVRPAVEGKDSGRALFSVAGTSCAPSVAYEWGAAALKEE